MPRQKTKHAQISSEKIRKSTFKRRLDSLFKKANELSILCGVEVVLIVLDRKDGHPILWPSQEKVLDGVMKFLTIPERERLKKMVLQEKFLSDQLKDATENLSKIRKKNEETKMGYLVNQLIDGTTIDELDTRQLNGLSQFVQEKLKKLQSRNDELNEVGVQPSTGDTSHHCQMPIAANIQESRDLASSSNATVMEDMRGYEWFGDAIFGNQYNFGFFRGIHDVAPESTEVVRSFIEGNQGEVGDFGKVCQTSFAPSDATSYFKRQ